MSKRFNDYVNFTASAYFGGTASMVDVNIIPSTSTGATLTLFPGVAPSTPGNGDIWTTSAGIYTRVNGVTVGPLSAGGGSPLSVYDEGSLLTAAADSINFTGAGITASVSGTNVQITVPGGAGGTPATTTTTLTASVTTGTAGASTTYAREDHTHSLAGFVDNSTTQTVGGLKTFNNTITSTSAVIVGTGEGTATPSTANSNPVILLRGPNAVGTDIAGGDLVLSGGQGVGAGPSGKVIVYTQIGGGSGSATVTTQQMAYFYNNNFVVGMFDGQASPNQYGGGKIYGPSGGGTNQTGGDLTIVSGLGTGNAYGGTLRFATSSAGSSGTGGNSRLDRMTIDGPGNIVVYNSASTVSSSFSNTGTFYASSAVHPLLNIPNSAGPAVAKIGDMWSSASGVYISNAVGSSSATYPIRVDTGIALVATASAQNNTPTVFTTVPGFSSSAILLPNRYYRVDSLITYASSSAAGTGLKLRLNYNNTPTINSNLYTQIFTNTTILAASVVGAANAFTSGSTTASVGSAAITAPLTARMEGILQFSASTIVYIDFAGTQITGSARVYPGSFLRFTEIA